MNIKMVIFSGIMTALIAAMISLAISEIAQKQARKKGIIIVGTTLGFLVGAAYQGVCQQEKERYKDEKIDKI